jgi:hypothetical protein
VCAGEVAPERVGLVALGAVAAVESRGADHRVVALALEAPPHRLQLPLQRSNTSTRVLEGSLVVSETGRDFVSDRSLVADHAGRREGRPGGGGTRDVVKLMGIGRIIYLRIWSQIDVRVFRIH